jgi:hypothetical protein
MKAPDLPVAIPAPTADDKRFRVGDELTVYEAALVYAGRHPYPMFFGLKDGRNSKREHMLTYLDLKRPWAQLARDIFYELGERIKRGQIKPIRPAYDPSGKIDLFRTVIRRKCVVTLATQRGEQPKYLKRWLGHGKHETPSREAAIRKATKRDAVKTFIRENYPHGTDGVTYGEIARDLERSRGLRVDTRTIRRALGHK